MHQSKRERAGEEVSFSPERGREKKVPSFAGGERQKNDKPLCRELTLAAKLFNFPLSVLLFSLPTQIHTLTHTRKERGGGRKRETLAVG